MNYDNIIVISMPADDCFATGYPSHCNGRLNGMQRAAKRNATGYRMQSNERPVAKDFCGIKTQWGLRHVLAKPPLCTFKTACFSTPGNRKDTYISFQACKRRPTLIKYLKNQSLSGYRPAAGKKKDRDKSADVCKYYSSFS